VVCGTQKIKKATMPPPPYHHLIPRSFIDDANDFKDLFHIGKAYKMEDGREVICVDIHPIHRTVKHTLEFSTLFQTVMDVETYVWHKKTYSMLNRNTGEVIRVSRHEVLREIPSVIADATLRTCYDNNGLPVRMLGTTVDCQISTLRLQLAVNESERVRIKEELHDLLSFKYLVNNNNNRGPSLSNVSS
jgi:hypothetical protein